MLTETIDLGIDNKKRRKYHELFVHTGIILDAIFKEQDIPVSRVDILSITADNIHLYDYEEAPDTIEDEEETTYTTDTTEDEEETTDTTEDEEETIGGHAILTETVKIVDDTRILVPCEEKTIYFSKAVADALFNFKQMTAPFEQYVCPIYLGDKETLCKRDFFFQEWHNIWFEHEQSKEVNKARMSLKKSNELATRKTIQVLAVY